MSEERKKAGDFPPGSECHNKKRCGPCLSGCRSRPCKHCGGSCIYLEYPGHPAQHIRGQQTID